MVSRKLTFLVLILSISPPASGAWKARRALLRDGFALTSVDGKLVSRDSNEASQSQYIDFGAPPDRWFFEFDSDVTDGRGLVKAGESLELLPSAGLEKMIASLGQHPDVTFRLYKGRVTEYKGRNFIFPSYFLTLSKSGGPPSKTLQTPPKPQLQEAKPAVTPPVKGSEQELTVNEPNDVLAMPKEVIDKLKARRVFSPRTVRQISQDANDTGQDSGLAKDRKTQSAPQEAPYLKPDSILVGRTALFGDPEQDVFVLDALGRNVPRISLRLLPCQALQWAEQDQSAEPDPVRFRIAGIVTEYKGRKYLLLQKATRVFSHKNFPG